MHKSSSTVAQGYRRRSIVLHWISALAVFSMYVTGAQGEPTRSYHVAAGTVVGVIFLLHVFYRVFTGIPTLPPDKEPSTSLRNLVIWIFLALMVCLVTTGFLLPWANGSAVELFTARFPAPAESAQYLSLIPLLHKAASYSIIPLIILHIIQAPDTERIFTRDNDGL